MILNERFTQEYLLDRIALDIDGCWIWQMSTHDHGYGQLGEWPYTAHSLSYRLWRGEVPKGLVVRHLCHVPGCCRPDHLELGTHRDNWNDSKEVHQQASVAKRGRPARNRQPIRIYGKEYPSKDAARTELKISYERLLRDCESPSNGPVF